MGGYDIRSSGQDRRRLKMRIYGLKIGTVGVEFSMREDRERAMVLFSKGSCMAIADYAGPRFKDGSGTFSTYERNTEEQINNCSVCSGTFSSECCPKRTYPAKSYKGKFDGANEDNFICDGCFTARIQDKKLADAEKVVEDASVGKD